MGQSARWHSALTTAHRFSDQRDGFSAHYAPETALYAL
jgi:hypothetical protein